MILPHAEIRASPYFSPDLPQYGDGRLDLFERRLPKRPYCAYEMPGPVVIRPKEQAVKAPHLQIRADNYVGFLPFDVDLPDAACAWLDAGLPEPYWIAANLDNGHAHLVWALEYPVTIGGSGTAFLGGMSEAMTRRLGADSNYVGLLTKNPFAPPPQHYIHVGGQPTTLRELYALSGFEPADLRKSRERGEYVSWAGRNVALFEALRHWAYAHVKHAVAREWHAIVMDAGRKFNVFEIPLGDNEIKHTAKSVATWVWKNRERFANWRDPKRRGILGFEPLAPVMEANARLAEIRLRQVAGALYSAAHQKENSVTKIIEAIAALKAEGKRPTQTAVVKASGLSKATVERHWKAAKIGQLSLLADEQMTVALSPCAKVLTPSDGAIRP